MGNVVWDVWEVAGCVGLVRVISFNRAVFDRWPCCFRLLFGWIAAILPASLFIDVEPLPAGLSNIHDAKRNLFRLGCYRQHDLAVVLTAGEDVLGEFSGVLIRFVKCVDILLRIA